MHAPNRGKTAARQKNVTMLCQHRFRPLVFGRHQKTLPRGIFLRIFSVAKRKPTILFDVCTISVHSLGTLIVDLMEPFLRDSFSFLIASSARKLRAGCKAGRYEWWTFSVCRKNVGEKLTTTYRARVSTRRGADLWRRKRYSIEKVLAYINYCKKSRTAFVQ